MTIFNLNKELIALEVSGSDAKLYLQGQLSNDIHELDVKPYQFAAHLNNKGRIIANFIITKSAENSYLLLTSRSLAEKIVPRLKMFILRSKVSLSISSKSIYLSTTSLANALNIDLRANTIVAISSENITAEEDPMAWRQFLVEAGIPMIYLESTEKIIPQQINYDLIGGINFKKGCYTGQEIVARTHYLGKIKRRMVRFTTSAQPQIGQTIVSPLLDNQEIGYIVDFYMEAASKYCGLASLQTNCIDKAYLDTENLLPLTCESLIKE